MNQFNDSDGTDNEMTELQKENILKILISNFHWSNCPTTIKAVLAMFDDKSSIVRKEACLCLVELKVMHQDVYQKLVELNLSEAQRKIIDIYLTKKL